ncbi:MAG: type II toxin-antitoxin system PemK/MazF family toxin [Rhodoferax sp.]|nr:type II toxin-antitoxin system PemK/MazF family toxin [Rhodoferax sp.]
MGDGIISLAIASKIGSCISTSPCTLFTLFKAGGSLVFDPSSGQETKGPHFGLILSGRMFNQQELLMICAIPQGSAAAARTYGTVVTLMGSGTETQGAIHCHQINLIAAPAHSISLTSRFALKNPPYASFLQAFWPSGGALWWDAGVPGAQNSNEIWL